MQVPDWLRDAIDEIAAEVPAGELARAASELSDAYRAGDYRKAPMNSAALRAAYVAQRLPATWAVNVRVFEEIRMLAPEFAPKTILDVGAGPGTSSLAAVDTWPDIQTVVRIEQDESLIAWGRVIAREHGHASLIEGAWLRSEFPYRPPSTKQRIAEAHTYDAAEMIARGMDVVVASYVLGELQPSAASAFIQEAWTGTSGVLAIIEPGTPRGFAQVLAAREELGRLGAHIVAPCPRAEAHPCPMAAAGDWCHFAQRVERSSLHRKLKGGELGYEDEKFSYVVVGREPMPTAPARIVRHPMQHKGHVELQVCTPRGVERATVGRSDKERYRAAKRAEWGDGFTR